jgi:AraC-like DNA-binding protein
MPSNFFAYFPGGSKARRWGIYATAFGEVTVPPGATYPPTKHPTGHHFVWDQGRVLAEHQILFISRGAGLFESERSKRTHVSAGDAFLLFPGVRHRYRPDPATGWTEFWLELEGEAIRRLQDNKIIDPKRPVYTKIPAEEIRSVWLEARRLVLAKPPGFSVQLGLMGLQILTLLHQKRGPKSSAPQRMDLLISEAQTRMASANPSASSPARLAKDLGVAYSYFRRSFKDQTGMSPKQYQSELRLRRVKHLLQSTSRSIKEIAEELGYHSPFHLTQDFTKRTGQSPSAWRKPRPARAG